MAQMEERYINPLTDFGFKRLFGSEFNKEEMTLYEDSVKAYRDIANAIRTAEKQKFEEGKVEGKIEIAKGMKLKGFDTTVISELTGLTPQEILLL